MIYRATKFFVLFLTIFFVFLLPCLVVYAVEPAVVPSPIPQLSQLPKGEPQTITDVFFGFAIGNAAGFFPALIAVGLVTFFAGVLNYLKAGDNEEARSEGRSVMIFGIIVLMVMVSIWGLVSILTQSFFKKDASLPNYLPGIQR